MPPEVLAQEHGTESNHSCCQAGNAWQVACNEKAKLWVYGKIMLCPAFCMLFQCSLKEACTRAGRNAEMRLTMARVQGKKEYMPAALSRYDTARSALKTGCTMRALMTAKKSTLAYSAPSILIRPACVVTLSLHTRTILLSHLAAKVSFATKKSIGTSYLDQGSVRCHCISACRQD